MMFPKKMMNLERSLKAMSNSDNQLVVDEKKVNILIRKIIIAEARNIKSEEKDDTQMAKEIRKKIEEEVKCY